MAVPQFHELMLPILRITGDGHEHTLPEVIELLADKLELSLEDRTAMLPGGSMTRIMNRVGLGKDLPPEGRIVVDSCARAVPDHGPGSRCPRKAANNETLPSSVHPVEILRRLGPGAARLIASGHGSSTTSCASDPLWASIVKEHGSDSFCGEVDCRNLRRRKRHRSGDGDFRTGSPAPSQTAGSVYRDHQGWPGRLDSGRRDRGSSRN